MKRKISRRFPGEIGKLKKRENSLRDALENFASTEERNVHVVGPSPRDEELRQRLTMYDATAKRDGFSSFSAGISKPTHVALSPRERTFRDYDTESRAIT